MVAATRRRLSADIPMTQRGNQHHTQISPAPQGTSRLSPRQDDILRLAAEGLGDDEIGRRLHLSDRALRFEFESVFVKLGVRDRERAITVWAGVRPEQGRVQDRCPYHRPFPSGFSECVAYRPRRVAALDLDDDPTATIWTCRHLQANPREDAGWYAGCAIGRPADRERWAAEQPEPNRLRALDRLTRDLAMIAGPFAQRLWSLKRDQRLALGAGQESASRTHAMDALADGFIRDLAGALERHRPDLDRYQLPAERCLTLAHQLISSTVPEAAPAEWDARFDRLMRLPEEAWAN